ncbi:hypothetical protein [Agromyces salentinus]|nr:hypothetical protein [Agromyces salentinus]
MGKTLRASLAVLATAALTFSAAVAAVAIGPATALNASDLAVGDIATATDTGTDFRIHATDAKKVTVDAHERVSDRGETFTQRIKLNGSGTADARSLHFTVAEGEAPTRVHVNARSGGSADRALALYDATGAEVGRVPARADLATAPVETGSFDIAAPGAYYLASPSSGVNVYFAQVGEFEPVTRAPWAEVAAPVIESVEADPADPGRLVVSFTGVLGVDGGDVAHATLHDGAGSDVDTAIGVADGEGGALSLTPPASGDYEVEVRLTRSGEPDAKASARVAVDGFSLPLAGPSVTGSLTTAISGGVATVTLDWSASAEAESYSVESSIGGAAFTRLADGLTGTTAAVAGFVPGTTHQVRIVAHRGAEEAAGPTQDVEVAASVERWQVADIGSNAGSGGQVTENADGSITFDALASTTKLATSEDGFQYYYTKVDPATENFTLTATFRVDDAAAKDNQSGFGVIAVDTLVPGSSPARYFNSAGALLTRYAWGPGTGEWQDGTPGARFVHGYTGAPDDSAAGVRDSSDSVAFDRDWRPEASGPKFANGDVFTLSLRKSNTGFHAVWHRDGEVLEVIQYDPDMLQQQDSEALYVGMAAARKIKVTVTDWDFSTIHPDDDEEAQQPPTEYVPVELAVDVTSTTPHHRIDLPLVANVHGTGQILGADGEVIVDGLALTPGERVLAGVDLVDGENEFTARVLPAAEQPQLGEREELESNDPVDVPVTVTVDSYGEPGQSIRVAPDGSPTGHGTAASPIDLHTAVAFAQPGQQIVLEGGVYTPQRAITVERGRDGTPEAPITLMSAPGARAVLDLAQSAGGGLVFRGDWWHVYDLEITGSQDRSKPMLIQGHHNVVERVESHHNRDTGIQISGLEREPSSMWPSHNLVVSSVAHDNADAQGNDADGFAAKLTVGEGNVFRHSIAHHNIDDGWDLYAKSTTGPIGTVVVEDSVAYANGWLAADPARTGEGNGFKLGGESVPGDHLLRNSISFGNLATGVTSNSGPDIRLEDVTAVGNERNIRLSTNAPTTAYAATGVLSWTATARDELALKQADTSLLTDPSNHFNLDSPAIGAGQPDAGWFVSTDVDGAAPTIAADGSVDMHGLFAPTERMPLDTGARLSAIEHPTAIEVLPEVVVALENTVAPSIEGDAVKGRQLSADTGEWSREDAALTVRWLRDGEPIPGRVGQGETYKVRGADVGHELSIEVTASVAGQDPVVVTSQPVVAGDRPSVVDAVVEGLRSIVTWLRGLFGWAWA